MEKKDLIKKTFMKVQPTPPLFLHLLKHPLTDLKIKKSSEY